MPFTHLVILHFPIINFFVAFKVSCLLPFSNLQPKQYLPCVSGHFILKAKSRLHRLIELIVCFCQYPSEMSANMCGCNNPWCASSVRSRSHVYYLCLLSKRIYSFVLEFVWFYLAEVTESESGQKQWCSWCSMVLLLQIPSIYV